ncbi:uncharacterized protein LOC135499967 [Lineus longissimus]|uniref:uncharacterized protein LOC135499967 n=1 Tax=Lineus longissimus TaxID=88925 RepID=UPI00315D2336
MGLEAVISKFTEQINLSRLPTPKPAIFSGNPLEYPAWNAAFETLIESRGIPPAERMHYLKKYLGGPAKEAVEGYFFLSEVDSFSEARKILKKRFGDPFVIGNAFREKVKAWKVVESSDGPGLRKLADFLRQCAAAMRVAIYTLGILNDKRESMEILKKLPNWLASRWNRSVYRWVKSRRERATREGTSLEEVPDYPPPPFEFFLEFMEEEAELQCDPVTSIGALRKPGTENKRLSNTKVFTKGTEARALATGTTGAIGGNAGHTGSSVVKSCLFCKQSHDLDSCGKLQKEPMKKRKDFIFKNGVCYGCLKKGAHRAKDCKNRIKCRQCQKLHPTILHGDQKTDPKETQKPEPGQDPRQKRRRPRKTWCMARGRTLSKLDMKGTPTKLNLSTMSKERQTVETSRVKGLLVRGLNSELKIKLPATYTREIMPSNRDHIPTPSIAREWPHLCDIAEKFHPQQSCEVGLLIGYNCARALTPREVVCGAGDEPFAQKTDLGWGIVGNVGPSKNPEDVFGTSHCLKTFDTQSDKLVLAVQTIGIDEDPTPKQLFEVLTRDIKYGDEGEDKMSQEDRKFLNILEEGIHRTKDGRYEMPLPLKTPAPVLPNNKSQAEKRLRQLRARLSKDETYRTKYTDFMNDMLDSGHASKVPQDEVDSDNPTWYIPHFGVVNPEKNDKVPIVFDCSARYKDTSLNDNLLQGPDLTNNLLGVLMRFRQEPVALQCDIKKMFLNFRVNPEHRDMLRFLWWPDGDLEKEPTIYRMNVHLFGATSSPGCANFALRRMAEDYEDEFGSVISDFVKRNYYMDDGIGSTKTDEEAIGLFTKNKAMCGKIGLELHKVLSNSPGVMQSIAKEDLAQGVKDLDLSVDTLPIERTLGVFWCIEKDIFQFRITLKDRPFTRRGVLATIGSVYGPLGMAAPVVLVGKRILQELCADGADWDDPLPENLRAKWETWIWNM